MAHSVGVSTIEESPSVSELDYETNTTTAEFLIMSSNFKLPQYRETKVLATQGSTTTAFPFLRSGRRTGSFSATKVAIITTVPPKVIFNERAYAAITIDNLISQRSAIQRRVDGGQNFEEMHHCIAYLGFDTVLQAP